MPKPSVWSGWGAGLALVLCAACGRQPSVDLLPAFAEGGYVPRAGVVSLRFGPETAEGVDRTFWLPRGARPVTGWSRAAKGWRPDAATATLLLRRGREESHELYLDFGRRRSTGGAEPAVTVELNGEALFRLPLERRRTVDRRRVPGRLVEEVNRLVLRFEGPLATENGRAAVWLQGLGLLTPDEPARDRESEGAAWRRVAEGVRIDRPGSYLLPAALPAEAESLAVRAELAGPGVDATVRVSLLDRSESPDPLPLGELSLRSGGSAAATFPVGAFAGRDLTLVFDLDFPDRGSAALTLTRVSLALSRDRTRPADRPAPVADAARARSATPGRPPDPPTPRPDVVLILLDAARGDRFVPGAYGRETTPHLSRMADEALLFERAYSECPTTSCSVPNLLTGMSFLGGGDVFEGRRLPDEVTTLAEYLKGAGYRTVGLTATPNHSRLRNTHQGYDEFYELWGKRNPDHGPENAIRLAQRVVEEQPAGEPLFLHLHLLPPHQPYDPPARFDRFTDPAYRGPVVPGMSLRPYSLGVEPLAGDDLAHLVGLYDGNLLMADHLVAGLFATLREAGRWQGAVTLVTSDHGEAFMEHGHQGHNTTLFDEMLHVPLILRLPGGERPAVDLGRPAGLLDVVPTLLARLGIAPREPLAGDDLLAAGPPENRLLFHRTSHPRRPSLAVRDRRWKALYRAPRAAQALFDLAADPGEERSLLLERPLLYADLGLRLRRHLRENAARGVAGEAVELTPEAEEALRALGYVN